MVQLKLYLDSCCFNRPFDDQSQLTVRLETEAILFILQQIYEKKCDLIWSSILDLENKKNPFDSRREAVDGLRKYASLVIEPTDETRQNSLMLQSKGLKPVDSLHVACAISVQCDYFITTDYKIINKPVEQIAVVNPIHFVRIYEEVTRT